MNFTIQESDGKNIGLKRVVERIYLHVFSNLSAGSHKNLIENRFGVFGYRCFHGHLKRERKRC